MKRIKIKGSSNISEIGYDHENLRLEIKFHSGGIYVYWPVTLASYNRLRDADSMGSYFYKHIKSNPKVQCTKVDEIQT